MAFSTLVIIRIIDEWHLDDSFIDIIEHILQKYNSTICEQDLSKVKEEILNVLDYELSISDKSQMCKYIEKEWSPVPKKISIFDQLDKISEIILDKGFNIHYEEQDEPNDIFICIGGACEDARCGGWKVVNRYRDLPSKDKMVDLKELLKEVLTDSQLLNDPDLILFAYQDS